MIFRKGFLIHLDEALAYPDSATIRRYVRRYAESSGEALVFASEEKPVTFYLEKDLYAAEISMERGGYVIHCRQI